jgi:hypothetical protein
MSKLMVVQIVLIALLSNALAEAAAYSGASRVAIQYSTEPGVYLTPYELAEKPPKGFEEFDSFRLKRLHGEEGEIKVNRNGDVPIAGSMRTRKGKYNFKSARLIKGIDYYERLTFTTVTIRGVSYTFDGRFQEYGDEVHGQFITLKGVLTKLKNGRKLVTARLGLYQAVQL